MPNAIRNDSIRDLSIEDDVQTGAEAEAPPPPSEDVPMARAEPQDEVVDLGTLGTDWSFESFGASEETEPKELPSHLAGSNALNDDKKSMTYVGMRSSTTESHSKELDLHESSQRDTRAIRTSTTVRNPDEPAVKMSSAQPVSSPWVGKPVSIEASAGHNWKLAGGEVSLYETKHGSKQLAGGIEATGSLSGPSAGYEVSAGGNFKDGKFTAQFDVKVNADLVDAKGKLSKEIDFDIEGKKFKAEVELDGEGKAGIDGTLKLDVSIGKDGIDIAASGDAFAGAKLGAGLGIKISAVADDGKLESILDTRGQFQGSVGASAGVEGKVEFTKTSVEFKTHAQVTVGFGGGLAFSGKVDAWNLGKAAARVGEGAADNGHLVRDAAAVLVAPMAAPVESAVWIGEKLWED